jgi:uncharacterized protein (UPF0548 family)
MTFSFRRPTEAAIGSLIASQARQPWSYDWPEITRADPAPRPGWQIDRHRVLLGHGAEVFAAACQALCGWKMFPREMCEVFPQSQAATSRRTPKSLPPPGEVVAVLYRSHAFRLWMLFPARVVYLVDGSSQCGPMVPIGHVSAKDVACQRASDRDGRTTFGFAYGTLPAHPERGEERFLVEWNRADDSVWYDLLACSRPGHWLARLGYPYARYEQAKFRRLSGLAMQAAVSRPARPSLA